MGKPRKNFITLNGVTHSAIEWAEIKGIHISTIEQRLKRGCTPEQILHKGSINEIKNNYEWTESAQDCYRIGCRCTKCTIPNDIKKICRMKRKVVSLVKDYGSPFKKDLRDILLNI